MQIKKTSSIEPTKLTALIYSPSGHGKTTLAGTLNGKTLIVSLESGLLSLRGKSVDYVEVHTLYNLKEILTKITASDYDNIFFDSLTEIASLFVDAATEEYPEDRQALKKWGHYGQTMTKFIKYTRDWNKNVFYTCLEKTDKDEAGRRFNLPDMPGSIARKIPAYMDFVFNLRVFEKNDEKMRALMTSAEDGYICKDRSGKLNGFEKPHLGDVINKIFN